VLQSSIFRTLAWPERRAEQREKVVLRGRIVFDDHKSHLDCTILNESPSGAEIKLAHSRILPKSFFLVKVAACTAHRVVLVWQKGALSGLYFEQSYALDALPADLAFLNTHWIACAAS
jgi:hypothetical protein